MPDRLDVQEVRARAEEDEYSRRSWFSLDRYVIQLWLKRLLVLGVLGALGYFAVQSVEPLGREFSAATIADRLSRATGQKVTIGARAFRHAPSPRLVLVDVAIGERIRLPEVALHFNWDEALRAVRAGGWAWGEAEVAPLALEHGAASALLDVLPQGLAELPQSVSTIRFPSVTFPEYPLLPGRYQMVLRRGADGAFGPITLEQLGSEGRMLLKVEPVVAAASGDASLRAAGDEGRSVRFELEAQRWTAPVGPATPWAEVSASGIAGERLVWVDSYTAAGFFGVTQGLLVAARDVMWSVTGIARSTGVDLESVFRQLQGGGGGEAGGRPAMSGTAALTLVAGGHGQSLVDAVEAARLTGPVQVRWGSLNGINLGLAATQGGGLVGTGGGGLTRFTELEAFVVADRTGIELRGITGRAGAMATRGEVRVSPTLQLTGALRVDLGAQRVQAPLNLRVRGSALAPEFGR